MVEIKDSRKPWAVLIMTCNSHQILPEQTKYFWFKRNAKNYVWAMRGGEHFNTKLVRNG